MTLRVNMLPFDVSGSNTAWQNPNLVPIKSVGEFSMVVVVTENPDIARVWIEQVQPYMKQKPLLMIVSAQTELLIQPYYKSNQVQGMIAGLSGATSYETLLGRIGTANEYWTPFSMGILASTFLIIIVGFINIIIALLSRKKSMI
jgi:hypothetical protein